MQDKKVVALIILAVLAAASLIYGVTASSKGRARSTTVAVKQAAIMPAQGAAENVISTTRRAKRSQFKTWNRNPFASGFTVSTSSELTLNGIIWNKARPKAMIGDTMVSKGDTIGSNKVIDIQPKKVILNDGTKDFELNMEK